MPKPKNALHIPINSADSAILTIVFLNYQHTFKSTTSEKHTTDLDDNNDSFKR